MLSKYENCKQTYISSIMKRFEMGKLFIRGRRVRSYGQAIAMALKMADKHCQEKLYSKDVLNIADKIRDFLDTPNNDIKQVRYAELHRIALILDKLSNEYQTELLIKVLRKLQILVKRKIPISKQGLEEFRHLCNKTT